MKLPLSILPHFPDLSWNQLRLGSLACLLLFSTFLSAQPRRSCGTMEHLEDQLKANPNMLYDIRRIERDTDFAAKSLMRSDDNSTITIPVVIHVVYNTAAHNISDAQIYSQIRVLNEDFQRQNPDKIHTDPQFLDVAGNTHIEFRLAEQDPEGNPTNGITRTRTSKNLFYSSDNAVKYSAMGGVDAWPTAEYLNIWICSLGSGILGYSQFPGGPKDTDGVVIGYRYFGTVGAVRAPFNRGRTTTHEIGHWLNLRHIWGDGPCGADDHVDDTPLAERPHHGCLEAAESCGSPDMVQNFMDYTDDACMNLFTQGQAARMRALFTSGGHRESLKFSQAIAPQVVLVEESEPVLAFYPPASLNADGITASAATLSWDMVPGADKYRVRVRPSGDRKWATRTFSRPYVNTNRLMSCTTYEFQVASLAHSEQSVFSDIMSFQTLGCAQPVVDTDDGRGIPGNLNATEVMGQQATINWTDVSEAESYEVQYKQVGKSRIYTKLSYQPATVLYGLERGIRYLFRVRANFADGHGKYSKVASFVPGSSSAIVSRQASRVAQVENDYFRLSTEGYSDLLTIEYDLPETDPVLISILDDRGEFIESYEAFEIVPGEAFDLDLSHLSGGDYQIQIEDSDGFQHVKHWHKR